MLLNSNINSSKNFSNERLPRIECLDIIEEMKTFTFNNSSFITNVSSSIVTIRNEEEKKIEKRKQIMTLSSVEQRTQGINDQSIFLNPDFKLLLSKNIETPLCKGKYFTFKVYLQSTTGISFPIREKIDLEVLVFSLDDILITKNMKGKDILRGNYMQHMNYFSLENMHVAYFKIQFTEVSSHFVGKSLKLKIKARKSAFIKANGWKIQSITTQNLCIKAKDPKVKSSI